MVLTKLKAAVWSATTAGLRSAGRGLQRSILCGILICKNMVYHGGINAGRKTWDKLSFRTC